jgi:LacI family transcriptional regulator
LKVRIKDIADRAGVSTGTVDRVLHNRGEVSDKTRKRVVGILEKSHYEPDILARTLASRNPLKVAVLIPFHSPENWFWKKPLSGIYDACSELNHFKIEIKEFLYDQFRKQDFIEKTSEVLDYFPDAVIAAPVYLQETIDFFSDCEKSGIPFISVNDNINHPGQLTYVGQDSRSSSRVAAKLIDFAVPEDSRILVVSIAMDKDNYSHILRREEGFREYWVNGSKTQGIEIIPLSLAKDSYPYIKRALTEAFQKHDRIAGIFVTNSRVYQVAKYLQNTSREDVSLVGYDLINPNIKYLNNGVIDFLISQKPHEQGYKALVAVFNKLKMNKKPLPEQLIPIDIICKENLCCYQV